jgi:hypothetical protein
VAGSGFRVFLPAGWTVQRARNEVGARRGSAIVSVTVFTLLKSYSPELFTRAARELDGVAAKLAAQSRGRLTERATTTVDGLRIRAYRFTGRPSTGPAYEERIGFVLQGKREYQLLCQAAAGAGDPDGACALLFASFQLAAG